MDGEKGDAIKVFVSRLPGADPGLQAWSRPVTVGSRPARRPQQDRACCSALRHQSQMYCEETSLHGVKYAARESGWKRCYWIIILLAMTGLAAFSISGVVDTYITTPTLVSIDSTDFPIHKIPFPALTICNLNKVDVRYVPPDQYQVFGRTVFSNETEWAQRVQSVLTMVYAEETCGHGDCPEATSTAQQFSTDEVKKIMRLTSPSCEEMIFTCSWRGSKVPCSTIFQTHHTDFGYCCLFNAHYEESRSSNTLYTGPGDKNGLTVMLDAKRYEYFQSQFLSVGFKVLVHGTHDEPEVRERGMAIQPGREIFVAVSAEETYTTELAESSFSPNQRNCFKEHEVKLKFSDTSIYTLANCLLSHEAEALFDQCGCVAYYMPGDGKVCHEKDILCLRSFLHRLAQDFDMSAHFWDNCLPACDETKYSTELSTSEFPSRELIGQPIFEHIFQTIITRICLAVDHHEHDDWEKVMVGKCPLVKAGRYQDLLSNVTTAELLYGLAVTYAQQNMAKLHFYFKTNSGTRYKRDVLYTNDQFIANIGGLLGLFLGFSIVSSFEVIYFFCLNFLHQRNDVQDRSVKG